MKPIVLVRTLLSKVVLILRCRDIDCAIPKERYCLFFSTSEANRMMLLLSAALRLGLITVREWEEKRRCIPTYMDEVMKRCNELYEMCCSNTR